MKYRVLALLSAATITTAAHAQIVETEVSDGTTSSCTYASGPAACAPFFSQPTIDSTVTDGTGNGSEITTIATGTNISTVNGAGEESIIRNSATQTTVQTTSGSTISGLNVQANATALESLDPAIGYGAVGTQVGTSSASGLVTGQVVATANDSSGSQSGLDLEGSVATIRTVGASGERGLLETTATRTLLGYSADGTTLTTGLRSTTTDNTLVGNSNVVGTFGVSGLSTLNGIDNSSAGITNAGLISGVTPGTVSAGSSEAVNGSQLFATNANVTTAQNTANTAVTNAAAAQTTANTALANAATAQTTANTAVTNAAAAQTTANTALANAATAQTTADTAVTNAAAAQTTANTALTNAATAQTTADTAVTNAAAAQTTANTALTNAATAQTTANSAQTLATTANTNAAAAVATANTADANASAALTIAQNSIHYDSSAHTSVTLNSGGSAVSVRNVADGVAATDAVNMRQLTALSSNVTTLGTRVTALETALSNTNADLRRIDAMAGRGTAIATAIASIPPISDSQKFGFGVGVGTYDGRTAFSAAVIGRISDNAQFRLNAGTTGNGKVAAGGGMTFGW